jgi:Bacterial SH3 domain
MAFLHQKGESMKRALIVLTIGIAVPALTGCSFSLLKTPKKLPTPIILATPTQLAATLAAQASVTPSAPTGTPIGSAPTATPGIAPTATTAGVVPTAVAGAILPGVPSGPYAVILVAPGDVLNIRSAPGVGNPVIGSLSANNIGVMRVGPSSYVGGALWVQVQDPGGAAGWVNAVYLTEYVAPAAFCADGRVNSLVANFSTAIQYSDASALSAQVSPAHGMTVRLWRNGNGVVFDQAHSRWIFTSTFEHNWGAAPGSGLDTIGAIHVVVLPKWLDVLGGSYTLSCNVPQTGGASYDTSWPAAYTNLNFYSVYKPGPAGNELAWRTLLVGVEYVQGQPYIFSVTQLDWEP